MGAVGGRLSARYVAPARRKRDQITESERRGIVSEKGLALRLRAPFVGNPSSLAPQSREPTPSARGGGRQANRYPMGLQIFFGPAFYGTHKSAKRAKKRALLVIFSTT
jgi:hypothetical protein